MDFRRTAAPLERAIPRQGNVYTPIRSPEAVTSTAEAGPQGINLRDVVRVRSASATRSTCTGASSTNAGGRTTFQAAYSRNAREKWINRLGQFRGRTTFRVRPLLARRRAREDSVQRREKMLEHIADESSTLNVRIVAFGLTGLSLPIRDR